MRVKGKLIKWHADRAFGFIAPNGGGSDVFIHVSAFANRSRVPQINDLITFTISQDKNGRYCAIDATYSGEKLNIKEPKKSNAFSLYLSLTFLFIIIISGSFAYLPKKLTYIYLILSAATFLIYAFDKAKAKRGKWRTQESTLHLFALVGGWPGAALAQQLLRHKSSKQAFRHVFWATVLINLLALLWLISSAGANYLVLLT